MKEKNGGNTDVYRPICGLPINTYFSAVKMRWLLQNCEEVKAAAADASSGLLFGTIDTWLIAKLSGLTSFATDSSNASRTMLMDIHTLEWSDKMTTDFGIDNKWLPAIIKNSDADFGRVSAILPELEGVVIGGVLGDQQAACLGHVLREGEVKNTYGTGCFILANVGSTPVQSSHGLLTTVCYRLDGKTQYALEGAVEIAGSGVEWAKSVGLLTDTK